MKPFLKAIEAQVEICKSKKIDMFKASVSLHGAAQCCLMATSEKSRNIPERGVWVNFLQDHTCRLREYLENSIPVKNIAHPDGFGTVNSPFLPWASGWPWDGKFTVPRPSGWPWDGKFTVPRPSGWLWAVPKPSGCPWDGKFTVPRASGWP